MGVSAIGAYCFVGASTVATFVGKMGVASGDIGNCTRKLYICERLSPFANVFS